MITMTETTTMTATQLAKACNEALDICSVTVETKALEVFPTEFNLCALYRLGLAKPTLRSCIRLENFLRWISARVG